MTDPMTTPPLDLPALRDAVTQSPSLQTWGSPLVARLLDRVEELERELHPYRPVTSEAVPEYDRKFFESQTRKSGHCLEWIGYISPAGYGRASFGGKAMQVHRFAWEIERGPVPSGLFLDHKCHNRKCCNVEHLRLATRSENGRHRAGVNPTNKSTGVRNVYRGRRGKYEVRISIDGKIHNYGSYSSLDEASVVAERERAIAFGRFAGRQ